MIKVIGISGKKHSGKDTLARIIKTTLPDLKIERIAFADALKEEVCAACGVTLEYLEEHKDIFRPILQWWGTDFRRNLFGKDYWIKQWLIKVSKSDADAVVCTDVRFKNEYAAIEGFRDSVLLRVQRELDMKVTDTHSSEVELDDAAFDYVMWNMGTLAEFEAGAARFTNRVLIGRLGLPLRGEP